MVVSVELSPCGDRIRKHKLGGITASLLRIPSLYRGFLARVVRATAPPLWLGVVVAAAFLGAEAVLVWWLRRVAPQNAYGALFLLGVLVVSAAWDFGVAAATSVASAVVYVILLHRDSPGPALVVFLCLALVANVLARQARSHAAEAEQRRAEADLVAEIARTTLHAEELESALNGAGQRVAQVIGLPYADLVLFEFRGDEQRLAVPLREGDEQIGTLVVPTDLPGRQWERLRRLVPPLEALVAAMRHRQQINAEVSALARQQAALRRVATLVARGATPDDVYLAAVAELAHGLEVEHATLIQYDGDECVVLAVRDISGRATLTVGERFRLDGLSICAEVVRTSEPGRVEDYLGGGVIADRMRGLGLRSRVGAPVVVGGEVRGALIAGSATAEAMPAHYGAQVGDFADLVATAISNAENKAELQASRARIVAAADQARRGFERDLHDGAQQRLVKLGLDLRDLETSVPAQHRDAVRCAVKSLMGVHEDLRELSCGMHPAILSKGGLGPAIKALMRRSAIPTSSNIDIGRRLAEPVEAAAYYVVAEALTNTTKHAHASTVHVSASIDEGHLHVSVSDNGVGGAVLGGGSGLIGLKDRVESVSGKLTVSSPPGQGTTLTVSIPVN
ncbi:GAF domain-containing sensor histidine kinase [Mycobacterium sp. URHB0021]